MENKINKTKYEKYLLMVVLSIFMFFPLINGLGISSDYGGDNLPKVAPGETKTINILGLMSSETTPVKIKVELSDKSGFITPVDKDITLKPGVYQYVPIKVSIPENVPEGTSYSFELKFLDITPKDNLGTIGFSKSSVIGKTILVERTLQPEAPAPAEKPAMDYTWYIVVLVIVIIIAIVAYFLLRNKNIKSK